jgi:hypothetical protein
MFLFIARLFLLRQPQSGLSADDSNRTSASSVNGWMRNEMSFECPAKTVSADTRLKSVAEWLPQLTIRDHVARLPAAQIG